MPCTGADEGVVRIVVGHIRLSLGSDPWSDALEAAVRWPTDIDNTPLSATEILDVFRLKAYSTVQKLLALLRNRLMPIN